MRFFSARRAMSAGIVAAASVAALAAPGMASAETLPGKCNGVSTEGAGSSLQAEAQAVWDPGFNKSKVGCPLPLKISYKSIGSGAGRKEWSEKHNYGTIGFVGTDNTVNSAEKSEIEGQVNEGASSKVLTIPVLQGAVAIVMNLPAECTATSTQASGRLALDQPALQAIYAGTLTKWSELETSPLNAGAGDTLTGAGCGSTITPVVRKDKSGTTHIFKKFLYLSNKNPLVIKAGEEKTWAVLAEGGSENVQWPEAAHVLVPAEETGPGLLKAVAATPGSIGYANLADARNPSNGGFTGQSASRFWAVLESSKKLKGEEVKSRKYTDPSKNKDTKSASEANCKDTVYKNEGGVFPPPSTEAAWNEVGASGESKTYALCGLTYDLALTNYSAYSNHGGNANEAQTVIDFLGYELNKSGGAKDIKNHDYAPLSAEVLAKAKEGVEKITD